MAKIKDTSSFGLLTAQNTWRKSIIQDGQSRSNAMPNFQAANINKNASMLVQTTEMQLRSNAQASAKAKIAQMTALQDKVDKSVSATVRDHPAIDCITFGAALSG
jgi:hypothetical protein